MEQPPWVTEPDFLEWDEEQTGLHCTMIRGRLGQWCGYVTLPANHPWHGLVMEEIDAEVHGGVTWSDYHLPDASLAWDANTVAEALLLADERKQTWVIGFDCAHAFDFVPELHEHMAYLGFIYRDQAYVHGQCELLALQVMAVLLD